MLGEAHKVEREPEIDPLSLVNDGHWLSPTIPQSLQSLSLSLSLMAHALQDTGRGVMGQVWTKLLVFGSGLDKKSELFNI